MEVDSDNISVAIVDMLQQLILGAEGTIAENAWDNFLGWDEFNLTNK